MLIKNIVSRITSFLDSLRVMKPREDKTMKENFKTLREEIDKDSNAETDREKQRG